MAATPPMCDFGWPAPVEGDLPRDLHEAMCLVAETGRGPAEQVPSLGCSIKWRAA